MRGAYEVAEMFNGRAQGAETVLLDDSAGAAWIVAEKPNVMWDFTIIDRRIEHIDMLADPELLGELALTRLV